MKTLISLSRTACPMLIAAPLAACATSLLPLLLILALPGVVQAQFNYTNTNGAITITEYTGGLVGAVTIPASINGLPVTTIGIDAFAECKLTSVTIPNSVTSIGYSAFAYCNSLTNVTIPSSVTSIGDAAFAGCASLTAIMVDALNSSYSSVDGVLFNKSQTVLVEFPWAKTGSYKIPAGVTSIGDYAFAGCHSLTNLTIPNSVTSIGDSAFPACTGLTSVTIPDAVTSIRDGAFTACISLTSVTIPDGVTSIGGSAFDGCYSLTNLTIPNGVTSIGDRAFSQCTSLTNATIPNTVTSIGDWAFAYCNSLTNVAIPNSVTNLGEVAFGECTNLTGVYFQGNAPYGGSDVFWQDYRVTSYYLFGTTGWGTMFGGRPVLLNGPVEGVGVRLNQFGFSITAASNITAVVEASTNLASSTWFALATNTLASGSW